MQDTVQSAIIDYTKDELAANEIMGLSYMLALPSTTTIKDAHGMELLSSVIRLYPAIKGNVQGISIIPGSENIESFDPEPELEMRMEWFAKNAQGQKRPEQKTDFRQRFRAYSQANYQVDLEAIVKADYDFFYVPYHHSFVDRKNYKSPDNWWAGAFRASLMASISLGSYSPMFGLFVAHDLANSGNFYFIRASLMHHEKASMENIRTNIRDIFGSSYNQVMPLLEQEFAKSDEVAFRSMNYIINNVSKYEFARLEQKLLDQGAKSKDQPLKLELCNCGSYKDKAQVKLDIVNKALEQGLEFNEVRAMMTKVFG